MLFTDSGDLKYDLIWTVILHNMITWIGPLQTWYPKIETTRNRGNISSIEIVSSTERNGVLFLGYWMRLRFSLVLEHDVPWSLLILVILNLILTELHASQHDQSNWSYWCGAWLVFQGLKEIWGHVWTFSCPVLFFDQQMRLSLAGSGDIEFIPIWVVCFKMWSTKMNFLKPWILGLLRAW